MILMCFVAFFCVTMSLFSASSYSRNLTYIYNGSTVFGYAVYTPDSKVVASDGSSSWPVTIGETTEVAYVKFMTNYKTSSSQAISMKFSWTDMKEATANTTFPYSLTFGYNNSSGAYTEQVLVKDTAYTSFFSNPNGIYVDEVVGTLSATIPAENAESALAGDYSSTVTLTVVTQ